MEPEIPMGLTWGENRNREPGQVHIEWHAACGCAFHPKPFPHVHPCSNEHKRPDLHTPADDTNFDPGILPTVREPLLAQSLKELLVKHMGNDMAQWPERQQEFKGLVQAAVRGGLWKLDDWKCKRCDTMNLEAAQCCRKCGEERGVPTITPSHPVLTDRGFVPAGELKAGDSLIMRTHTVPGSLLERVLDERTEDLHRWAEGKDFHANPTLPPFARDMTGDEREQEQSRADAQHGDPHVETVGLREYMRDYPQEYPPCPFCGAPNAVGVKECGACHRKFTPPFTKFQE